MNSKNVIRFILGLFIAGSLAYLAVDTLGGGAAVPDVTIPPVSTGTVMYYFTQGKDCSTCDNIESYAAEALDTHFGDELESGVIVWQKVDTDEAEHGHFNKDFNLYTKSIVLVRYKDGEVEKWENLEDVWDLVYEKPEYIDYVKTRTAAFLSEAP